MVASPLGLCGSLSCMGHDDGILATLKTGTAGEISSALASATALTHAEIVELSALSKAHDDAKLRKVAKRSLDEHAPAASAALTATIKSMTSAPRGWDPQVDVKVTKQLRALEAIGDFPDVPGLAAAFVARTQGHLGLAYLCELGGQRAKDALQASIDANGRLELDGIKHIPDELAHVEGVRFLSLRNCGLKVLPEPVLRLRGMTGLDLSKNKLAALPEQIAQLEHLEQLVLHDVPLTRGLGAGLVRLTRLRELDIMRAAFSSLPEEIGALTSLERLEIVQCDALTSVPASIGELARLRHLELDHCKSLTAVPESVWSLRQLEYIDFSGLKLGQVPDAIGEFRALKELQLRGCEVELPSRSAGARRSRRSTWCSPRSRRCRKRSTHCRR
jgi:hypothetical protein